MSEEEKAATGSTQPMDVDAPEEQGAAPASQQDPDGDVAMADAGRDREREDSSLSGYPNPVQGRG